MGGLFSSEKEITNIEINWRRRIWNIVDEPISLYSYNDNSKKFQKWINLKPGDEYLTMVRLNHKIWNSQLPTIEHEDRPKWNLYDDDIAKSVYKLHIKINGVYKYVPLPIKINLQTGYSGIYIPPPPEDSRHGFYEDPDSLNQLDRDGNPIPDTDSFSHIISNYEGLPVATEREISNRMIEANSDMSFNNFLNPTTKDKIRF